MSLRTHSFFVDPNRGQRRFNYKTYSYAVSYRKYKLSDDLVLEGTYVSFGADFNWTNPTKPFRDVAYVEGSGYYTSLAMAEERTNTDYQITLHPAEENNFALRVVNVNFQLGMGATRHFSRNLFLDWNFKLRIPVLYMIGSPLGMYDKIHLRNKVRGIVQFNLNIGFSI